MFISLFDTKLKLLYKILQSNLVKEQRRQLNVSSQSVSSNDCSRLTREMLVMLLSKHIYNVTIKVAQPY